MEKTGTKTELKVAQQAIKIFETFLCAYTDGIAITDFSHNNIVVNEALCNFLGKDYQEVAEANLFDWLEQLDGDAVKKWATMEGVVRKEGESRDVEFTKTAHDTVLYLSVNASVLERAGEDETDVIVSIWRDVTEHKQAEEALVHAAEDWQETFDAVDDLVAIVDSERNVIRANRVMKEVFSEIDLKEKKCYELFHGSDEPILLCPCTKSFETGELEHIEIKEPHLDDHIFDVFTYPIRVEEDGVKKVVHVVRDITNRKQAEEELKKTKEELEVRVYERTSELIEANKKLQLEITDRKRAEDVIRESEEKYRNIVESASVAIFSIDLDRKFLFGNDYFTEWTGYKKEDIIGKEIDLLIHPDDILIALEAEKRGRAGENYEFEMRVVTKYGVVGWGSFVNRPIFNEDGSIAEIHCIVRDITEKKRAEEALKDSEERYRNLVENINDVIFNIDIEGIFTYISPAINRISNYYNADELIGQSFAHLVHPEDLPDLQKIFERDIDVDMEESREFRALDKNGEVHHVRTSYRVQFKEGVPVGITGVMTDITELKKMEAQLIQTEKLSSLGGILSGVAHELNNPLTAIIVNSQLLARKSELPVDVLSKLDTIQKESMRCAKIVGGLLAFAREHKPERRMINVNDVIVESCKLREYELRVDNVDIELDLFDNIAETSADPSQLQQVFINLINNAHDALKEKSGGVLNIRSYKRDETILIEFEDNGPGIPKENINKIFDPFFTTKEMGKGTGLGLSIIYGIINEHGGKMNVEGGIDKGAKFTIELPIEKEAAEIDKVEMERPKKPEGAISVLVVEDEESLREVISEALSNEGYVVQTANSGDKAIELLKRGGYDVIISDMKMPGMSGQNLYTFVQKEYPELTDKMLFMTGDVLGKETQSFFKITGAKLLEKPFEIDVLLNVLNKVIFD